MRRLFHSCSSFVLGYGYCALNNSGSRYKSSVTLSHSAFKKAKCRLLKQESVQAYATNIAPDVWKLYTSKCHLTQEPQPLACHGASILAISKIILMQGIEFLIKHLRPDKSQLLYLDTDSMHIALNDPTFENNVAKHMKSSFDAKKYYFLDEDSAPSGMLVIESIVDYEQIFAEKFYTLKMKSHENSNEYVYSDKIKSLACRGVPQRILSKHKSEIESLDPSYGYQESAICRLGANLGVANSVRYKILGGLMVPSRRFFFDSHNSIPFTFPDDKKISLFNTDKPDYRHYLYEGEKKDAKTRPVGRSEDSQFHAAIRKKTQSGKVRAKSRILETLMARGRSVVDITDAAYMNSITCSDDIPDAVYVPPKKRKKNAFIDYECKS